MFLKESEKGARKAAMVLGIILITTLLATVISAATELRIDSVTVRLNENGSINVTLVNYTELDKLSTFSLYIKYNSSIMQALEVVNLPPNTDYNIYDGVIGIAGSPDAPINYGSNYTLGTIVAKALKNDGSKTPVEVFSQSFTIGTQSGVTFPTINGTFTTLDEVPPTITFDVNEGQTIAGPEISVNATAFDLSGIDASSVEVWINDTKLLQAGNYSIITINDTATRVYIYTNVSELGFTVTDDVSAAIRITVSLQDNSTLHNSQISSVNVTVAKAGFSSLTPTPNSVIADKRPTISARYALVDPDSIKMYLDGSQVNPTIDTTTQTITYTPTFDLSDGLHTVLLTGNLTLAGGGAISKQWNFTVDTIQPAITYFNVKDSDGDTFNEVNEALTVFWNVTDANFDRIVVLYNGQEVKSSTSANASFILTVAERGDYTFVAYDKAGNNNSVTFHIYNNYLAYVVSSKKKEVMGLDITKLATLDVMDRDTVDVTVYNGIDISLPVSSVYREIVPGTKAGYTTYIQSDANRTITNFYQSFVVYDSPRKPDFKIRAPAEGVVILARLNDSKAEEVVDKFAKEFKLSGLIKLSELPDYVEYFYFFSSNGWAKAEYDRVNNKLVPKGQQGTFRLYDELNKTLEDPINIVNLTPGFKLSKDLPYYDDLSDIEAGSYVIMAISVDGDVVALDALMPLIVLNGTQPTLSSSSVQVGEQITITFPQAVNRTAVFMLKDVTYSANVSVNLTESLAKIGKIELKYGDKELRELTYKGKHTKIWIPKGMAKGAYKKSNIVTIDTSNLETNSYKLYVVAQEYGGLIYYAGVLTITLTQDITPPEISYLTVRQINATHAYVNCTVTDENGVAWINMTVKRPDGTTKFYANSYSVEQVKFSKLINVSIDGTYYIEISAKDVVGNVDITNLSFVPEKRVNESEEKTIAEKTVENPVEIVVEGGTGGVNVSVEIVTTKDYAEVNATLALSAQYKDVTPVKYVSVNATVVGNVSWVVIKVYYTPDEIRGLDENRLSLYYWNATQQKWIKVEKGKWLDKDHYVYDTGVDTANDYVWAKLSNFSVFALGGVAAAPAPAPALAPARGAGGG
ncbi:hypothetical protein DRP04_09625, partial [Archaeoglobales archaeon]